LEHHKHWLCPNDLNHCVHGITQKYVVARPLVPIVWPIQEGIDLIEKEATTLKEMGFSFDCNHVRSLFGSQSFNSNISHVPIMNAHNIVWLIDASC
jgi:hypothetical protein